MIRQLLVIGAESVGVGPDEHGRAIKSEFERVAKAIAAAGLKPE